MASSYASAAKRPTSTPFSFKRTVRLNVPKDNTDITTKSLLEALTEQGHQVVRAQGCYGGRAFDVMLKTPADAEQLAMRGFDERGRVPRQKLHIRVRVHPYGVPTH
jgi:hypothetical protein